MLYETCFGLALVVTLGLTYKSRSAPKGDKTESTPAFQSFQWLYLAAYCLAMAGDWLQGPYVYALYSAYGYDKEDIALLFVAGFGSSMIFGTFVGSLADAMGRKKFAMLYCLLYIASCLTKHLPAFWTLLIGRLLGGIATSLLFSVFDSWMVAEHKKRGFSDALLGDTFSKATFCNSIVAIVAGVVAEGATASVAMTQATESVWFGGYCTPFDLAVLFLGAGFLLISSKWSENFGGGDSESGLSLTAISNAVSIIKSSRKILLIGSVASLFEGSMYTFVFLWTPLLTSAANTHDLPFGLIFASFMLSCMSGSTIFGLLCKTMTVPSILRNMLLIASAAILVPVLIPDINIVMLSLLTFEMCVGVYWPAMGTIKGMHVPESGRSAIYNVFRIPLNAIVLFVLLSNIPVKTAFACCAALLATAAFLQTKLIGVLANQPNTGAGEEDAEQESLVSTTDDVELVEG